MRNIKESFNFNTSIDDNNLLEKEAIFKKYKRKIDSYVDKDSKLVFEQVLLMINIFLKRKFNTNLIKTSLTYDENGAPKLSNGLNISYSHSENNIYIAISKTNVVGCDIEARKDRDYLGVAERFFDKEEYTYLKNTKSDELVDTFYKFRTIKEAYLKALKVGLSKSLSSFRVVKFKKIIDNENPHVKIKIIHRRINGLYASLVIVK